MAGARAASADVICTAAQLERVSIAEALGAGPLRIPVLQRRYCWGQRQLRQLWNTVVSLLAPCGAGGGRRSLAAALAAAASEATPPVTAAAGCSFGRVVVSTAAAPPGPGAMVLDGWALRTRAPPRGTHGTHGTLPPARHTTPHHNHT